MANNALNVDYKDVMDIIDIKIYTAKEIYYCAKKKYGNKITTFNDIFNNLTLNDLLEDLKDEDKIYFHLSDITLLKNKTNYGSNSMREALLLYSNSIYNLDIGASATAKIHKSVKNLDRFMYVQGTCTDGTDMYYIMERKEYLDGNKTKKERVDHLILKVFHRKLKDGKYVWYISDRYMNNIGSGDSKINEYNTDKYDYFKKCNLYNKDHFGHGGALAYVKDIQITGVEETGAILCTDNKGVYVINPFSLKVIGEKIILKGLCDYKGKAPITTAEITNDHRVSGIAYCSSKKRFAFAYKSSDTPEKATGRIIGVYKLLTFSVSSNTKYISVQKIWHNILPINAFRSVNYIQGIDCDSNYIYLTRFFMESDYTTTDNLVNYMGYKDAKNDNFNINLYSHKRNNIVIWDWEGTFYNYISLSHFVENDEDCRYFEIEGVYHFSNSDTVYLYVPFIKSFGKHAVTKRITLPKAIY